MVFGVGNEYFLILAVKFERVGVGRDFKSADAEFGGISLIVT